MIYDATWHCLPDRLHVWRGAVYQVFPEPLPEVREWVEQMNEDKPCVKTHASFMTFTYIQFDDAATQAQFILRFGPLK